MGITDNVVRSRMLEFAKQEGKHHSDEQMVLPFKQYHPLFDREEWRTIPILKKLRDKAIRQLAQRGVTLLGGSTEEAPDAYKPMDEVLAASEKLVKVVGRIYPRIVRMNQE